MFKFDWQLLLKLKLFFIQKKRHIIYIKIKFNLSVFGCNNKNYPIVCMVAMRYIGPKTAHFNWFSACSNMKHVRKVSLR